METRPFEIAPDEQPCTPIRERLVDSLFFDSTHPSLYLLNVYLRYLLNVLRRNVFASEEFYWERLYNQYSVTRRHPVWWHPECSIDKSTELVEVLQILSCDFGEQLSLADIGSGPVTSFFEKIDISKWNITCVDPLASLYNYLNQKYRVSAIACVEGRGEYLTRTLEKASYHLVLSQNAVDHSRSPLVFVEQMMEIVKPGGFLCLCGAIREGTAARWLGMHKWDIEIVGDDLVLSNKNGNIEGLKLTDSSEFEFFSKKVEGNNPGDHFMVIYRKRKSIS